MKSLDSLATEARRITAIMRLGIVCNSFLMASKVVVGFAVGSLALIADGVNSLTDFITDFAVIIGAKIGSKPADENHPYGHGKIETFVAGIVALGVLSVGLVISYTAIRSLIDGPELPKNAWAVAGVAAITIVVKEFLFHKTRKVADECRSASLKAKAWDHRSDVAGSSVVLAGGVGSMFQWPYADVAAGLTVGVVIVGVGARLSFDTLIELTEGWAGKETYDSIGKVLTGIEEIRGWHKLRARRIGRELLMDVHVMLDPELTVAESHKIVVDVETKLASALDWPVNLTIHIDPDNEEIRQLRRAAGDKTLKG